MTTVHPELDLLFHIWRDSSLSINGSLLGSFDRSCIRPQHCDQFAILEHCDVLSAHLQPHPQSPVDDAKTPKVGVNFTIRGNLLVSDDLAIDQNTCRNNTGFSHSLFNCRV